MNEAAETASESTNPADEWSTEDEEVRAIELVDTSVAGAITRSEVGMQLDAAHRYPRSIKRFMQNSITVATINVPTAMSCMYALPRSGKTIAGPSVRLAEIMAGAYGNLHAAARIVDIGDKQVTAQGIAWDLETNLRIAVEINRRITKKNGERFDDDMINVTCAAACSIALRNAIFRVVPRAFVDQVYDKCRMVAVGDAKTLVQRRDEVLQRLALVGADRARVLNALQLKGVEDITLTHIETLIGYGTAIKGGDKSVDELFPAAVATAPVADVPGADHPGRRMNIGKKKPEATAPVEAKTEQPAAEKKAAAAPVADPNAKHSSTCPVAIGEACDCGADGKPVEQ
jgi:hypothetical protein